MSQPALPGTAAQTSAEQPWPVRVLNLKISDYIDRMSALWVEGQLVEAKVHGGQLYFTLRDTDVDMSLSGSMPADQFDPSLISPGSRVVTWAKPQFWTKRGTLTMRARAMRPVGVGDLLARIEVLRQRLIAEGLFDPRRKKSLPFIPRCVGLITGRGSDAEHDVITNARRRWPVVQFRTVNVPVQGDKSVTAICAALAQLDADREVDVIVIARGGGATEELVPFSNETLLRAVAAAGTPVVSAIGHEADRPLLDEVADVRASTPTDAGRRIVPDAVQERGHVDRHSERLRGALDRRLTQERRLLHSLMTRPVMASPLTVVTTRQVELDHLSSRSGRAMTARLGQAHERTTQLAARVHALSPQSTLERGYAVVQHADGRVVMDQTDLDAHELLRVRVARGDFGVRPVIIDPVDPPDPLPTDPDSRRMPPEEKNT